MILLKKYTQDSIFDTGKYSGQSVAVVMKINPAYIVYSYFKLQRITFTDDILESIGIEDKYRFDKPGMSDDKAHEFYKDRLDNMTEKERVAHFSKNKKTRIAKEKLKHSRHVNDERRIYSKGSLANMNRGNSKLDLNYRTYDGKSKK